jgi:hypothetical protein
LGQVKRLATVWTTETRETIGTKGTTGRRKRRKRRKAKIIHLLRHKLMVKKAVSSSHS